VANLEVHSRATRCPRKPARQTDLGGPGGGLGRLAEPFQAVAQQPRDLHLRAADPHGDLRLRQFLDEAQPQQLPLAIVEVRQNPGKP
jgi:hypothetical protein